MEGEREGGRKREGGREGGRGGGGGELRLKTRRWLNIKKRVLRMLELTTPFETTQQRGRKLEILRTDTQCTTSQLHNYSHHWKGKGKVGGREKNWEEWEGGREGGRNRGEGGPCYGIESDLVAIRGLNRSKQGYNHQSPLYPGCCVKKPPMCFIPQSIAHAGS